jgi:hypothetical protein
MTTDEVYQYFGTAYAAAKAMGITKQAFSEWIKNGFIPLKRQKKIEALTKGKLIAREEEAKKPIPSSQDEKEGKLNYLPNFRYYDKKYGMCKVESIHFRKGKRPQITYLVKGKKLTSFTAKYLMQAADVVDFYCNPVFEGDILKLKNGEKFIFESLDMANKLKKLGEFKIIGSVFE